MPRKKVPSEGLPEVEGIPSEITPTIGKLLPPIPPNPPEALTSAQEEELDALFTYHPPGPGEVPKYKAIGEAVKGVSDAINQLHHATLSAGATCPPEHFERWTAACRFLARAITIHAPPSADTTAAIRCVRLVRNAGNELLRDLGNGQLLHLLRAELLKARWQANGAIALHGKLKRNQPPSIPIPPTPSTVIAGSVDTINMGG